MSAPVLIRARSSPWLESLRRLPGTRVAEIGPVAVVAAAAAALRLQGLGSMPLNPYYDAAVRSMGSSWHAFLVGAFNPNASVALDKPPLDLWLQVASTKVLGFSALALHLPQALASIAAVLLIYDLVRRTIGRGAGLAAAAALAVLPAEVMTARSDTMDAVMAALLVAAAWLVVRAIERGRARELYLAGAAVGLAFETKLFEALVPLPALVLLFLIGSSAPMRRRVTQLAGAGLAMTIVGLGWPMLFSVLQTGGRPYPLGSNDGSIWNTVFVYNGLGRLQGTSTQALADHVSPAGPGRLFSAGPLHLGAVVGTSLAAAVAVALVAGAVGLMRRRSLGRTQFALVVAMAFWVVEGALLLSFMTHFQTRYLEVLAPAIAALFGIAVGVVARAGARRAGAVASIAVFALAAAALVAPARESINLVRAHSSDGGAIGRMHAAEVPRLTSYLAAHRGGARYEYATLQAHMASPLIAKDGQPVLVLAGTPYHQLVGGRRLAAAVRAGRVRYALVSSHASRRPLHPSLHARTARGRMAAWVRMHGVDVTRDAGLHGYGMLYRLTPRSVGAAP